MNEIPQKVIKELMPIAIGLRKSGMNDKEIESKLRIIIKQKEFAYYQNRRITQLKNTIKENINTLSGEKVSKAEVIFEGFLNDNEIKFKSQYKIGPYKADFLVDEDIVLEIDGPQHEDEFNKERDKKRDIYMMNLGYRIMRVPLTVLAFDPYIIIDEIKKMRK